MAFCDDLTLTEHNRIMLSSVNAKRNQESNISVGS
jgi:hypothetical protein